MTATGTKIEARTLLIVAIGACFSSLGCSDDVANDGDEQLKGERGEEPIIGGQPAIEYPEAALIDGSGHICSGAIIAPRMALTAGHCIHGNSFTVVAPFAKKSAKGVKTWTDYKASGEYVNPDTLDVAIIVLDEPIALPVYPAVASAPVPDGTKAVNVGRIKNGNASNSALFEGRAVELKSNTPGAPYAYRTAEVIESGDSGGPVYVGSGAKRKIVAVNSGAGGGTQVLARVDLAIKTIQNLAAQNGGWK